jgi:cyclopropane-fatty-acyl-phospholipid synthase
VIAPSALRTAGTSPAAIAHHYDLADEFFRSWLGDEMVYSCALWGPGDDLAAAQRRKIDWFATRLGVRGKSVLDVGCGWGGLLERFGEAHGVARGVGLTPSAAQAAWAERHRDPRAAFHCASWVDHRPTDDYDAITAVESTEHFASDALDADEKVDVYRAFFERAAQWLRADGRIGLQLICLDNVGHEGSRPGRGPVAAVLGRDIFPESMPASLSEMVLGWETHFRLVEFADHTDHYVRTFRAWRRAFEDARGRAEELVGPATAKTFARYFAAGELCFRLREHALYRVILQKRPTPKTWAVSVRPSMLREQPTGGAGASSGAIRAHYDVSDEFYAAWLGRPMMYSSGLWGPADAPLDLPAAHDRKIDWFAGQLIRNPGARVLDVGCGWGGTLRRLVDRHRVASATGLTLSRAQYDHIAARPVAGVDVRLQDWADYDPPEPVDAIVSFGAFEHFARDDLDGPQRIAGYRRFFARCHEWLAPDGGLGLETIAHDGAPDTAGPVSRGPLGDGVRELYPESICPHLSEVVLGFEPWFSVTALRSDAADFARTFRLWQTALRAQAAAAEAAVGPVTVRRFRRYLAASEIQFRDGTLTNLRLVLRRRATVKR